jgi:4-amino-4-deoxy-L-arabinose transferase-like glycosyltransferase
LICLLAATVRLLFLQVWAGNILFHLPLGDEQNFHQTALALLGQGKQVEQVFLFQPLYSYYLAGVYGIFGADAGLVRTIQLFIGIGNCLVFYGLGRELGGRWVGRLSALMVALYGPLVFLESQLLAPVLTVPLCTGAFWCFLAATNRNKPILLLPAGGLLGLAMMARPNLGIILVVGAVFLLVRIKTWKLRGISLGLAAAGLVLGLSPSWIHNWSGGEDFVPVSTSGGHSFYIGNNPGAPGVYYAPRELGVSFSSHKAYQEGFTTAAERAEGKKLTPSEVSSYWFGRGLDFWAENPGKALSLVGRKALLSVHGEEMAIHHPYAFGRDLAPWLGYLLSFAIIFPFAVLGVLQWRRGSLLAWSTLAYLATLVVFYVADRYRICALAMLVPLAALGMVELLERFKSGSRRRIGLALGALCLSFGITQTPILPDSYIPKSIAFSYNWMGIKEMRKGNLDHAEIHLRRSVELSGRYRGPIPSTALYTLGQVQELRGDFRGAREFYKRAQNADPDNPAPAVRLRHLQEGKPYPR